MNLSKFAETVEELMFERGINRKQLAEATGTEPSSITKYLQGKAIPTLKSVVALADYFNCSTDFVLGLENESNLKNFLTCPPFSERLAEILNKHGYTGYRFCKESKTNESRFYEWLSGKHQPSIDSVLKLAKFLDVSVDYILGREK